MPGLITVGHGKLDRGRLADLLTGAGVQELVDVRRFPASRNNPDVSRDVMSAWLRAAGIGYRWEEALGGRRRLSVGQRPADTWWRVPAFRAYAAHTRSPEFITALQQVLAAVPELTVALMCSESVWWRCHRRLIADVAEVAHQTPVHHLMPSGLLTEHPPAQGARIRRDGLLVWDRSTENAGTAAD
ncbi:MAG: DUF488 domain-containing protein [Nocardioidaceae bacterium]